MSEMDAHEPDMFDCKNCGAEIVVTIYPERMLLPIQMECPFCRDELHPNGEELDDDDD